MTFKKLFFIIGWLLFYISFVLEFIYNVDIISIKGFSLKNSTFYFLILLAVWCYTRSRASFFDQGKIFFYYLLFMAWCLMSLLITFLNENTNIINEIIFFKSYMDPYFLMIIAYHTIEDESEAKYLLTSLMIFVIIAHLLTILSGYDLIEIKRAIVDEKYGRTRGAFSEPNQYAAFTALFLPAFIISIINADNYLKKAIAGICVLISTFCLFFTGSRGGLLAMTVGILSLIIFDRSTVRSIPFYKAAVGLLIVIIIAFTSFNLLPQTTKKGLFRNVIERGETQDLAEYSSGRLNAWEAGLKLFIKNPLIGSGWNTFSKRVGYNSHSDYILFLATTGIIGFLLFCSLYYRIWVSVRHYQKSDHQYGNVYISYISGFLSFLIAMAFVNIYNISFFFFLYTAIIIKLGYLSEGKRRSRQL